MDMIELEKKFKELLATRDTDSLNQLIPEVLSGISPVTRFPLIGRDLVDVNTSILGKPGRSVVYIKEYMSTDVPRKLSIYDPVEIPEGAGIPETHETVEYVTSIPVKYGKRPMVTRELIEDAQWDVIARNTSLCMTAAKEFEEKKVLDTLFDGGSSTCAVTTTAADTLALDEIREAMRKLAQFGWKPTDLIVNPDFWQSLFYLSPKATSDAAGETWHNAAFGSGNVGPIFGIPVTMTPLMTDSLSGKSRALMLARKVCGSMTLKRDWTLEAVADPITQQQGVVLSARFDVVVLHATAIAPITSL